MCTERQLTKLGRDHDATSKYKKGIPDTRRGQKLTLEAGEGEAGEGEAGEGKPAR